MMLVLVAYMIYATDVLHLPAGLAGAIFLFAKLWDAVSVPLAGQWSDATRSRLGRRRSWILASGPPMAVFGVAMWCPPTGLPPPALAAWIAAATLGFYGAFAAFLVPHLALGAELAEDAAARDRIFAWRQIASSLGMLPAFFGAGALLGEPETARAAAARFAVAGGVALVLTSSWAGLRLPAERPGFAGRAGASLLAAMRDVWRNPHARLLLFVFFVESLGTAATSVMAPYVMKYVVKAPAMLGGMLITFALANVLAIPLWVALARRFERHRLWLAAMAIACAGYACNAFLHEGSIRLALAAALVTGVASACGNTLGQAIKADVIDFDEFVTGERKEGAYFATWAFAMKLAFGLMLGAGGIALDLAGYVENTDPSPAVVRTILGVMAGVPLVCFLAAIALFSRFALSAAEHERIYAALVERRG
jgi:GPH family glycoside/pentoside/hexuronide:cation symporter